MKKYRIFKGRPEWRATIPDTPWTVLRWDPRIRSYATIGTYPSWELAWANVCTDWPYVMQRAA